MVVTATVGQGGTAFQWYKDGQSLGSAQQSPTLGLGDVQPAQQGSYVLVVTGCGSVSSAAFSLTVNALPTVILTFPTSATVNPAGPTITIPAGQSLSYQVFGGVQYERKIIIDRVNGFEIRQVMDNATGLFPIDRLGLYTITVTGANGCQRTVQGFIQTQ